MNQRGQRTQPNTESRIEIIPSPEDRPAYASLDDFMHEIQLHGFYGAERLMKAAIRRFKRQP